MEQSEIDQAFDDAPAEEIPATDETGVETPASPAGSPAEPETIVPPEEVTEPLAGEDIKDKAAEEPLATDNSDQVRVELEETKKINNGLLQAKVAATRKAQAAQDELSRLQEELRLARIPKAAEPEPGSDRLDVEFDDDGNAFIPGDAIPGNRALENKVKELEGNLARTLHDLETSRVEKAQAEDIQTFLGEKEGYSEAFVEVKEQWDYVYHDLFDQFVTAQSLPAPKSKQDALEIASLPGFQKAFKAKFPTGDAESLIQAHLEGGKYFMRKALDSVVSKKQKSAHVEIPADKPQSLSTATGADFSGDEGLLDRAANMTLDEYLNLTPAEDAKIKRLTKEKGY